MHRINAVLHWAKKGHPRHPLYKRKDSLLNDLDIEDYNERIGVRVLKS